MKKKIIISILMVLIIAFSTLLVFKNQSKKNNVNQKSNKTINKKDTTPPELSLKELEINENDTYDIDSFVSSCVDDSKKYCALEYAKEEMATYQKAGSYDITIIAKDDAGNVIEKNTTLIINSDQNTANDNKETKKVETQTKKAAAKKTNTNKTETKKEQPASNNSIKESNNTNNVKTNNSVSNNTTYKVTLKMDDGRSISEFGIPAGNKIPVPSETTREGRNFKEWQKDGKKYDFNTPVTSDVTLVAIYNDEPVITYKYGVKITTIGKSVTYDHKSFNASTDDIKPEAQSVANSNKGTYQELLGYVNGLRQNNNVSPLVLDDKLSQAATARAIEMAWSTKFSHTRPNGSSCFTVLNDYGIGFSASGENIAAGQSSAQSVYNSWDKSQGHHDNMINSNFNKIGIGKYKLDGSIYWVQLFTN